MNEKIIFVDENDKPIGVGTREEAWSKGIYVRIVRAIIRDEKGRILSQHRSATKRSYPNCWTDSASGHVDDGETYDYAMQREMKEEIGIDIPLTFIGKFTTRDEIDNKTICEFNAIYEGIVDSSAKFHIEKDDVTEVKWFELDELKAAIQQNPAGFTVGFKEAVQRYY